VLGPEPIILRVKKLRDLQDNIIEEIKEVRVLSHLRTYRSKIQRLRKFGIKEYVDMWKAYKDKARELKNKGRYNR